ncbi:hypothetical protein ACFVZH_03230 [Streptomyces sp. NPDC059534]|uniref:hypothetical protein n=1 Tax=Streptomyces sp. NPDC059534 TaxID=3346859 RepID=UPI0036A36183
MSAHQLPASVLLGAFAVTAAAAWTAAGRRRGAPEIAGALLLLQGALHLILSTAGSHAGDTGHPAMPGMGGASHAMPGMEGMEGMAMGPAGSMGSATMGNSAMGPPDMGSGVMGSGVMDAATGSGAGMLAVHLLAALLCGLWLAHGEAAFFTLARAALAHAFTPLRPLLARVRVPDAPRPPVRRSRRDAPRPHTVVLAHALSRRGPPRLSAPRATALGAHV